MTPLPHWYTVELTGGPAGYARVSADALPDVRIASPVQYGGPGDAWTPEHLLLAAVQACFLFTFRALADVFLRHRGDKRVQFELRVRREAAGPLLVKAEVPQLRVRPSDDLVLAVERICGQGSVVLR